VLLVGLRRHSVGGVSRQHCIGKECSDVAAADLDTQCAFVTDALQFDDLTNQYVEGDGGLGPDIQTGHG
jgi:hypothetical protein